MAGTERGGNGSGHKGALESTHPAFYPAGYLEGVWDGDNCPGYRQGYSLPPGAQVAVTKAWGRGPSRKSPGLSQNTLTKPTGCLRPQKPVGGEPVAGSRGFRACGGRVGGQVLENMALPGGAPQTSSPERFLLYRQLGVLLYRDSSQAKTWCWITRMGRMGSFPSQRDTEVTAD